VPEFQLAVFGLAAMDWQQLGTEKGEISHLPTHFMWRSCGHNHNLVGGFNPLKNMI
jgi:hypothetical protein